ncbi:MAG: hypothetical protein CSB19_00575 [Clostridiales bacterium]|nr:MAG: hypothetical protein CSB19_00575 [Clostridiales bacterium]
MSKQKDSELLYLLANNNSTKGIYFYKGKDITMNVIIQIRDVIDIIKREEEISFIEAVNKFYDSKTYKVLKDTETALWAEPSHYIADRYYEERKDN